MLAYDNYKDQESSISTLDSTSLNLPISNLSLLFASKDSPILSPILSLILYYTKFENIDTWLIYNTNDTSSIEPETTIKYFDDGREGEWILKCSLNNIITSL